MNDEPPTNYLLRENYLKEFRSGKILNNLLYSVVSPFKFPIVGDIFRRMLSIRDQEAMLNGYTNGSGRKVSSFLLDKRTATAVCKNYCVTLYSIVLL